MDEVEREFRIHDKLIDAVERQVERSRSDLQFFMLLNGSVVAGAVAALPFMNRPEVALAAMFAFLGAFLVALAGAFVSRNNKRYYRALVVKRTLLEDKLGLTATLPGHAASQWANLVVSGVTDQRKVRAILRDPDRYIEGKPGPGSSTDWGQWVLRAFAIFHVIAAMLLAHALIGCPLAAFPCSPS